MKYLKKEMINMIIKVANSNIYCLSDPVLGDSQVLTHLILIKKKNPIKCTVTPILQINKLRQREMQ